MTAEQGKQSGSGKKWLIGCGGCLGLLLVLAIAVGILGYFGFDFLVKNSGKSTQALLGSEAPSQYFPMGIPLPKGEDTDNMVILINKEQQGMVVAFDRKISEAEANALGNYEEAADVMESVIREGLEQASSQSKDLDPDSLVIQSNETVALSNQKTFPVINIKIKHERKNSYSPASVGIFHTEPEKVVVLFNLDIVTMSPDPEEEFTSAHDRLITTIRELADETALDDKLL